MRIISGFHKGRRLKASPPGNIRPTSDKLKETLFNVLGGSVSGSVFLDGYAGTGSIGLEALSRGASFVYFVDQSRKACGFVRGNLEALRIETKFKILEMDLSKALDICVRDGVTLDIAFLDPPYNRPDFYERDLAVLSEIPVLASDGILVIEHSRRVELAKVAGNLRRTRLLLQGDSGLSFYKRTELNLLSPQSCPGREV